MKERGILFSAPMVRALLAGTKMQTRRIMDPQPDLGEHGWSWPSAKCRSMVELREAKGLGPYGSRGDRLWVREAWRTVSSLDELKPSALATSVPIRYESDGTIRGKFREAVGRYRHARFMPRWASRIDLEVTEIRVQQLHDITDEDARAEGVEKFFTRFPNGSAARPSRSLSRRSHCADTRRSRVARCAGLSTPAGFRNCRCARAGRSMLRATRERSYGGRPWSAIPTSPRSRIGCASRSSSPRRGSR